MTDLQSISPLFWATSILICTTFFAFLWLLDAFTHERLVKIDITDKELQTHRNILLSSLLMEISLVSMYWFSWQALPFFIAFLITRTAHEFIDEKKFHVDRCSRYESLLHFGMWITVIAKTSAMFIWGFFTNYSGVFDLPFIYYIWATIVFSVMAYTSIVEWNRGKEEKSSRLKV